MGVIDTVREVLEGLGSKTNRHTEGAYWCDDCNERIPDFEVDVEEGEPPTCPTCGGAMRFERSPQSGCAC